MPQYGIGAGFRDGTRSVPSSTPISIVPKTGEITCKTTRSFFASGMRNLAGFCELGDLTDVVLGYGPDQPQGPERAAFLRGYKAPVCESGMTSVPSTTAKSQKQILRDAYPDAQRTRVGAPSVRRFRMTRPLRDGRFRQDDATFEGWQILSGGQDF